MNRSTWIKALAIVITCGGMASNPLDASRFVLPSDGIPVTSFDSVIENAGALYHVDPILIKAIIEAESQFDVHCLSPKGAVGLMQLLPATGRLLNVKDLYDPRENIEAGVRHFRYLMDTFSNDLVKAVAAYNAGERPVRRYRGVPPYPETQAYVRKVIRTYNHWAHIPTSTLA